MLGIRTDRQLSSDVVALLLGRSVDENGIKVRGNEFDLGVEAFLAAGLKSFFASPSGSLRLFDIAIAG